MAVDSSFGSGFKMARIGSPSNRQVQVRINANTLHALVLYLHVLIIIQIKHKKQKDHTFCQENIEYRVTRDEILPSIDCECSTSWDKWLIES